MCNYVEQSQRYVWYMYIFLYIPAILAKKIKLIFLCITCRRASDFKIFWNTFLMIESVEF